MPAYTAKRRKIGTSTAVPGIKKQQSNGRAFKVLNQGVPRAPQAQRYVLQPRSEIKICDNWWGPGNELSTTVPFIQDLCAVSGGAGVDERVGNKIQPTGFQVSFSVAGRSSASAVPAVVRLVIVQDFTIVTVLPTSVKDYFDDYDGTGAGDAASLPYMPKKWTRQSTFRVLHDETFTVANQPNASNCLVAKHMYVKPKGGMKQCMYQDTSSLLTSNAGGRVFIMAFTNVASADKCYINCSTRMYYRDN